ncbi:MAG: response regulator [Campylobacterales bacterium]|nr:response regulator [Campylobacterales bacterium]
MKETNININDLKEYSQEQTILLVEDDDELRGHTQELLASIYKRVDIALDGKDGLDKYLENDYDIVITYINMPNLNGIELIKAIREIREEQIVMVISAHNDSRYLIELIEIGVEKFILKPLQLVKLLKNMYITSKRVYEKKLLDIYQEQLEKSQIELIKKNRELNKLLEQKLEHENQNCMFVHVLKNRKNISDEALKHLEILSHGEKKSAVDFFEKNFIDLQSISEKIEESLVNFDALLYKFVKSPSDELRLQVANLLTAFRYSLDDLVEFQNISFAIKKLVSILDEMDNDKIKYIQDILFSLSSTLEQWRVSIFVNKDAKDIHYFDASIITDCKQVEIICKDVLEGGEMEFFI